MGGREREGGKEGGRREGGREEGDISYLSDETE